MSKASCVSETVQGVGGVKKKSATCAAIFRKNSSSSAQRRIPFVSKQSFDTICGEQPERMARFVKLVRGRLGNPAAQPRETASENQSDKLRGLGQSLDGRSPSNAVLLFVAPHFGHLLSAFSMPHYIISRR